MMLQGCFPIVSLDRIYLSPKDNNILFLDCTRLDNSNELVSRINPNDFKSVSKQIEYLSNYLLANNLDEIIIADDVIFSGKVLQKLISLFAANKIKVIGARSAIATIEPFIYFNEILPLGLKCSYLLDKKVIDQICERDFYYGIAGSGISVLKNNQIYKSPYFLPFGNPVARASIPLEEQINFSKKCLEQNIYLWQEIESLSSKIIYNRDLPEKILNTKEDESVIKTLKKERKKL